MDDLTSTDAGIGYNARVCLLLPTAGERLDILLKALLGAASQRYWRTGVAKKAAYRIIVCDEKARVSVLRLTAAVYALGTVIRTPSVTSILQVSH